MGKGEHMLMFQEQADYEEVVGRFHRKLGILMENEGTTLRELYCFLAGGVREVRRADRTLLATLFSRQLEELAERWADERRTVTDLSDLSHIVRHIEESSPERRVLAALGMIIADRVSAELRRGEPVRESGIIDG